MVQPQRTHPPLPFTRGIDASEDADADTVSMYSPIPPTQPSRTPTMRAKYLKQASTIPDYHRRTQHLLVIVTSGYLQPRRLDTLFSLIHSRQAHGLAALPSASDQTMRYCQTTRNTPSTTEQRRRTAHLGKTLSRIPPHQPTSRRTSSCHYCKTSQTIPETLPSIVDWRRLTSALQERQHNRRSHLRSLVRLTRS